MNTSRNIIFLFIASILAASATSHTVGALLCNPAEANSEEAQDTLSARLQYGTRNYLPGEVRDTAEALGRDVAPGNYESKIHLLARPYGDSIVLRWAAEDYVSWQYLNAVGVNIYRYTLPDGKKQNSVRMDTLALRLKPASLERWRALYPETDSLAGVAMGTLYGEGGFTQDQSRYGTGEMGGVARRL